MIYEIEVRPGPGSDFFQYYIEKVEAATADDAIKRVQRRNPGCYVSCTNSYNAPNSSKAISSDTEWHIGHTIGAVMIGGTLLLAFAGEWLGMVLGGAAATWLGEKITGQTIDEYNSSVDTTEIQNKKIAYLLAIVLIGGGAGFAIGSNIKASINDSSDSQTQLHRDLHSELDA